jgi:hypothetical protein
MVKRASPVAMSVPTLASKRPTRTMATARSRDTRARATAIESAQTIIAARSDGPKCSITARPHCHQARSPPTTSAVTMRRSLGLHRSTRPRLSSNPRRIKPRLTTARRPAADAGSIHSPKRPGGPNGAPLRLARATTASARVMPPNRISEKSRPPCGLVPSCDMGRLPAYAAGTTFIGRQRDRRLSAAPSEASRRGGCIRH